MHPLGRPSIWFRGRIVSTRIWTLWGSSAAMLAIGAISVGASGTHLVELPLVSRRLIGVLGFALIVGGPALGVIGMIRSVVSHGDPMIIVREHGLSIVRTEFSEVMAGDPQTMDEDATAETETRPESEVGRLGAQSAEDPTAAKELDLPWEEIDRIFFAGDALHIDLEGGRCIRITTPFLDIELPELADRLALTHRRALMGLHVSAG